MQRERELKSWVADVLQTEQFVWQPITGDASFRRYFRVQDNLKQFVVCDSPPEKENNLAFYTLVRALREKGLCVPELIAVDEAQGFMLLSDFGDDLLFRKLTKETETGLYDRALSTLIEWHEKTKDWSVAVPHFDQALLKIENDRTEEWFFEKYLGFSLSDDKKAVLTKVYDLFETVFLRQPQCLVHRDFHSRNLMLLDEHKIGIIDFQDAVIGPVTYDAISLFKDCYYVLPKEKVRTYCQCLQVELTKRGLIPHIDEAVFFESFQITGIQRHYKVLGIFARLFLRDGHERYLADLPRVLHYILEAAKELPQLSDFYQLMEGEVAPRLCAMQCHSQRA